VPQAIISGGLYPSHLPDMPLLQCTLS
jgi:hypothetical protein